MRALPGMALFLAASAWGEPAGQINQAVVLYHQASYDSALGRMQTLLSTETLRKRDSLALYQYLGMAAARLGRDSAATTYFGGLLALDSLFQFPRNEDPAILAGFSRAQEIRRRPPAPAPVPAPSTADPASLSPSPVIDSVLPETPLARMGVQPPPSAPAPFRPRMNLGYGLVPLGAGWLARKRFSEGMTLGILQAGGFFLSIYASELQSQEQRDGDGIYDRNQMERAERWQWVQRISLSTAMGAYLFSIIASAGE